MGDGSREISFVPPRVRGGITRSASGPPLDDTPSVPLSGSTDGSPPSRTVPVGSKSDGPLGPKNI